ncbi:MAG TPA: exodeoxyribonuclease VII large subunit [Gemmatimonadaceae bacterium]|nr:exodeoxyribonuclease VII large subunit [Gemmatimonadaceae bacterium]
MSPRARRGTSPRSAPRELDLFGGTLEPAVPVERAPAAPEPFVREPAVPGESPESAISIASLVRIAKDVLEGAFFPLWVHGEVSDFKAHRNGHWYFCLRDETSQLRCVVWSRDRARIPAAPDDGMQVVARGQLTVYTARGDMQFVVSRLDAVGDGLWRKALEQAQARLAADGLLAPERKRPIPRYPRRVAVVTSPDGAALRDIIAVVRRRCPVVEIVVIPAKVQGDGAPEEIVAAIERAGRWGEADCLIVGRGGGAREDLWAFNDERVARALAASPIPTISAVGHEIDVTLCDLVADLRAPTPSAAAEAAVPVLADLRARLGATAAAMHDALAAGLAERRRALDHAARDLGSVAARLAERRRARLATVSARLDALSPLAVLSRGYSVARAPGGGTLSVAAQFAPGDPFDLLLRDGRVRAVTEEVHPGEAPVVPRPSPLDPAAP